MIVILEEYGEIEVLASTLLSGKWKANPKWTTKKFIIESKKKFPDKDFDYSKVDYKDNDTKVIIGCPIHGDFEIRPGDFLRQTGCPMCKPKSLKEIFISNWLKENNIPFKHNHMIILSNGNKAFIDFVINGTYVEYNGIQHYKDVKFFKQGGHFQNKYFSFENQQERDNLVKQYCKERKIQLIEIPYTKTEEEIINTLKEII